MVIYLRCERCCTDVAFGPVLPATFEYFQRIEHNCAPREVGTPHGTPDCCMDATAGRGFEIVGEEWTCAAGHRWKVTRPGFAEKSRPSGELSPEDLTRLGLRPPLKPVP